MNTSGPYVDPTDHLWWLASRASGIVAIFLLSYSVLVGLMMGGKMMQRLLGRPGKGSLAVKQLLASHEYASLAALIAIGVHGVTLLGDAYLHPTLAQIALPFTIGYRSFYTSLGIIAGYVAVLLGLSFYFRSRIGTARWKKLHRWTVAAYALSVIHALGAGTDAASRWFEWPLLGSAAIVAGLFAVRLSNIRRPQPSASRAKRTAHARQSTGEHLVPGAH